MHFVRLCRLFQYILLTFKKNLSKTTVLLLLIIFSELIITPLLSEWWINVIGSCFLSHQILYVCIAYDHRSYARFRFGSELYDTGTIYKDGIIHAVRTQNGLSPSAYDQRFVSWFFRPSREFVTTMKKSPFPTKGCKLGLRQLSNEGSLACHTYCDTGHPF